MTKNLRAAPVSWDDYLVLQTLDDRIRRVDSKSWGLQDQMNSCLAALGNGELRPPLSGGKWLANLEANCEQKHRNRQRLFREKFAPSQKAEEECHKLRDLCNEETLAQVRAEVTAAEFELFQELADGVAYATIADRRNISLAALKSQIHRCRERLTSLAQ
ncbi:MAG: hypothetical protein ACKV2Q_06185 [Planctomycetaceae bacterium]